MVYDEYLDKDLYTYSYSLNHNINEESQTTGITMNYKFSPLTMRLMKRKAMGKLTIRICGLICGIFVLFGLLNRLLHTFMDYTKSKPE